MMKPIALTLSVILLLSCTPKKQEETSAVTEVQTTFENPSLTDQQITEGWQYLFDGKTLTGWRFFQNKEQNCWDVQNGTLHCKAALDADKRADILIPEPFQDYVLTFEWKISVGGNSGVMYHASEEFDQPYYSGPEYQVIDNIGYKGDLSDLQKAGAAYDMYKAENATTKPIGEWNESKIRVSGTYVEHWLNGTKVLEYEMGSDDWTKRKAISKWKDEKGYGMTKKGFIDFQDHGHEVWYRKIMIRSDEYDG